MMMRALALALGLLFAVNALAAAGLDAAREAYRRGDVRQSLAILEEVERSPGLTEDELVEVLWHRAMCLRMLDRDDEMGAAFDALLEVRPLYSPNKFDAPPDVRAAFQARADAWHRTRGVKLGDPVLDGIHVRVELGGRTEAVESVVVYARPSGAVVFQAHQAPTAGSAVVRVALKDEALWRQLAREGGRLELVLEAHNARGTPLARRGERGAPLSVVVRPEDAARAMSLLAPPEPLPAPPGPTAPPAATPSPPSPPASAAEPPRIIVVPPRDAPVPPPASAAPAPAPSVTTTPAPSPAAESSLPRRMRVVGGVVAAVATGVWALTAVTALVGGAALAAGGYSYYRVTDYGGDKLPDRASWVLAYQSGVPGGAVGLALAALLGVSGLALYVVAGIALAYAALE